MEDYFSNRPQVSNSGEPAESGMPGFAQPLFPHGNSAHGNGRKSGHSHECPFDIQMVRDADGNVARIRVTCECGHSVELNCLLG